MKTLHLSKFSIFMISVVVYAIGIYSVIIYSSLCSGCLSSERLATTGILLPSAVAALVIVIWVFLFTHFKD